MSTIVDSMHADFRIDPEWVRDQVRVIKDCVADYEAAHSLEDQLYFAVLAHIAEGTADNPAECAAEAVKTSDIDFARYCA